MGDRAFGGLCPAAACARSHLGADSAKLRHDLAMHRTGITFGDDEHRVFTDKGLFDTKTLAADRHDCFPTPHSALLSRCDLTSGSHRNNVRTAPMRAAHQRLTMRPLRSSKINANGQNRAELSMW